MPSDWDSGIVYAELSDVGMRRSNNQDSLHSVPATSLEKFEARGHLFVVADGMGAHAAGELASQMATERITMQYARASSGEFADRLRDAVLTANSEIFKRGQSNPEFHNMGTTASTLVICPEGAYVGHVGDSRVYRLRGGVLEQLTFDHSLVWEMEASGKTGLNVPKNVITRSLGPNSNVQVDIEGPFPVQADDCFLICSDGLTGLVDDEELGPLMDCLPEEKLVRVLVDLANLRGGPDNISLIVTRVKQPRAGGTGTRSASSSGGSGPIMTPLLMTSIFCFVAAALLALVGMIGPMVIAAILGLVSAGVAIFQSLGKSRPISLADEGPARTSKSPYRRYSAKPTTELYRGLGDTVSKLRDAAEMNNWMMEWKSVDNLQDRGHAAMEKGKLKEAIRLQAEAIVETMVQLREQHNRSANETAIDY